MNADLTIIKRYQVPVNIILSLFDPYVASIINYACAVWDLILAEPLETVHRKFLK